MERIGDATVRHSRSVLAGVGAITLLLGLCLPGIEIDTSFLSFVRPETRELVETIEDDFAEGSYLTLIFEAKGERSLLEPDLLHQQLRIIRNIGDSYPVTTFSLVEGIDRGLLRIKRKSLFEFDDYSTIAESILGLAGGRTVRDLERVSAHFLSHPEAIAFYRNLRVAQATGVLDAPGAPESEYAIPYVRAIKALVRTDPGDSRHQRRLLLASIRERVDSLATPDLRVHVLSDDLVAYDIDRETQRSAVWLGGMVFIVDVVCVALLFRSSREVAIVFVILAVSSVWTFGLAALLGVKLSFLHLLAFPILLGTGVDDALIFGRRLAEERAAGRPFVDAVRATFAGVGNAILLTTVTTFVAFLATGLTAAADTFASFFYLVSLSMLLVLIVTVLLEGALRAEIERRRGNSSGVFERPPPSPLDEVNRRLAAGSRRLVELGPARVVPVCLVLFALALGAATRLDSEMARSDLLHPAMPTYRANEAMQAHFGDFRVGYVLFTGDVENPALLVGMRQLEERLSEHANIEQILGSANVDSVIGLMDKLRIPISIDMDVRTALERVRASDRIADYAIDMSFHEALDYVARRGDGNRYDGLLIRFFVPGEAGSHSLQAVEGIHEELSALGLDRLPGVEVRVGGGDVIYPLESVYYAEIMIRSFFLSLAANFAVLVLMWRRLGPSLLAVTPLVFATALVIGAMPLFGVSLNPLNLGIGAIIVGLGIDYPIHILERYDEERRKAGTTSREAAGIALDTMGPHMLAGMLTTSVGFCASCVLLLPMSTSFGLLTGAAIVIVYLATLFLLPVLLGDGRTR